MDIFLDQQDRKFFLGCLRRWLEQTDTRVWAYCLMTNHFHLVLVPTTAEGMVRCLHGMTFRYAQYFNRRHRRSGRLWQNRYYSCPVEPGRHLWVVARYIERNPVRAGIVRSVEDWRWSSAEAHVRGTSDGVLSEPSWLDRNEIGEYRRHLTMDEEEQEDEIRRATSTGRPWGTAGFVAKLERSLKRVLEARPVGRPRIVQPDSRK